MSAARRAAPRAAQPTCGAAQQRTTVTPCLGQGAGGKAVHNPAYAFWPLGLPRDLNYPRTSLCFNLESAAARFPDKPAVVFYDRVFSYAEIKRDVDAMAGFLQQRLGVQQGDRILLLAQNCPQFLVAYYAIMRAGAAVVPVNAMCTADEVAYFVADSGARTAIVAGELLPAVAPCLADCRLDHAVAIHYADALPERTDLAVPDWLSRAAAPTATERITPWAAALSAGCQAQRAGPGPDALCALPYTSGTTGHPKGCIHTHATLTAAVYASAMWRNLNSESVFLAVAPLFHLLGMQNGMNLPLLCGGTIVMLPRWDRVAAARLIERYRVSTWAAPPAMLVDFFAQDLAAYDLSSLALLSGGGAAMPEAVATMLKERYGLAYNEAYGLTETASFLHGNPVQRGKRQCLGVATFGVDSRIIDPTTLEELPQGQTGELITSAPQLMKGYWNNPEANALAFIERDGKRFLRTGDLAAMDAEGYYFMQDRLKRMITVSGYKVWPAEVENILYGHPAIHEACVIAAADAKCGEAVKAVIALKPEARGKVRAEDIIAWGREHMAVYKAPRSVEFVDELPKSNTGKILWRAMQEQQRAAEKGEDSK
ncbi:MAG: long-chain-fatty-acid--CoA ligase [Pseudomonadota bacterium]